MLENTKRGFLLRNDILQKDNAFHIGFIVIGLTEASVIGLASRRGEGGSKTSMSIIPMQNLLFSAKPGRARRPEFH